MIKSVIFDMDGLLLDTEPLWKVSMFRIAQKYQIPIQPHQFKETTGLKIYDVVKYWSQNYSWEDGHMLIKKVSSEIIDDIIQLSKKEACVMPGAENLLKTLNNSGLKVALATSSPQNMMDVLIDYFKLTKYFDILCSADSVAFGKPHPDVFLYCADLLKCDPLNCIVLEDSINGMIATKAARMKSIVVPAQNDFDNPKFLLADFRLKSLVDFDIHLHL